MEGKINLEGVLYNKDGSFRPLTSSHGNINGDLANLRNTYMEAERDYFEYILADKDVRDRFIRLLDKSSDTILACAIDVQNELEYGNLETEEEKIKMQAMTPEEKEAFHMKKLEMAEAYLCLLFAAARDKVKIKKLVIDSERKSITHGRR